MCSPPSAIILFIGAAEIASMHAWSSTLVAAVLGAVRDWRAVPSARAAHASTRVLDVRLFADPTFRTSMLGGTLARFAVGASPLLLPLLLQIGLGWTPLQTGLASMGQAIGTLLAKAVRRP